MKLLFSFFEKFFKNKTKKETTRRRIFVNSYEDEDIDVDKLLDYFSKSYILKSFYNFIKNTFSTVQFYKVKNNIKIKDNILQNKIASAISSYYFFSVYYISIKQDYIDFKSVLDDRTEDYVEIKRELVFTRKILDTILEYERIVYELFKNAKNTTLLMLDDSVYNNMNSALYDMIENIKNNRRVTELNNLSVLDVKFDKLEINTDFQKYEIDKLRTHINKTVASLLNINSELLNDNDTTFNNKQSAYIQFYNTVVLNFVNSFVADINNILTYYNFDYKIDYDIDVYLLKERELNEVKNMIDIYKSLNIQDEEFENSVLRYLKNNIMNY